jgi:hypothetical protein
MRVHAGSLILSVFLLSACSATQRYKWNSEHAHVSSDERLTPAEVDQIIRVVSEESIFPIICISRYRGKYSNAVTVFTDLSHDPQRFMEYDLKKKPDGLWYIVDHGEGSTITCQ